MAPPTTTERTVFVLEDDPLIANELEEALKDFGWRVAHRAYTFEGGMHIAQRASFDVAIMDVNLGQTKSYAVALAVSRRRIPFLLCTGYALEPLQEKFPDILILQKPFSAEKLRITLEQAYTRGRA